MKRKNKRPILITGSHRSGTTWVGNVVNNSKKTVYVWEPFNCNNKKAILNINHDYWFMYLVDSYYENYYRKVDKIAKLKFSFFEKLKTINSLNSIKWFVKTWYSFNLGRLSKKIPLVKDPIAFFSTEWLVKEFHFKPIILIRHPAAFVSSLKRLNWEFDFQNLLNQRDLVEDKLIWCKEELIDFCENKKSIIEQGTFLWKIFHVEIIELIKKHPDWYFIKHEQLASNPMLYFKEIFDYAGLNFSDRVVKYINKTTLASNHKLPKKTHELKRDSKKSLRNWEKLLSQKEISYIYSEVSHISSKFYDLNEW